MEPDLFVVDFDDIYEELLECGEELSDIKECLEFLRNSENPNVQKWFDRMTMNGDVLTDIMAIIEYYLEEHAA